MRLTRLPAAVVTAVLLAGAASCATTIEGSGTAAPDLAAPSEAPSGSGSDDPSPTPSSTADPVQIRQRALCVLERAAITGINTSFNKSKQRTQQIQILKQGAATIGGQLSRSKLPADDGILRAGTAVRTELTKLFEAANGGKSPSTKPYNDATVKFQLACNSIP
jgi:type IV pilus biogenesis protein CpaD/CtpE